MLGRKNERKESSTSNTPRTTPSSGSHSINSIVNGTSVEGTVKANSDIRVDGHIKGKLFCDSKVIIGPTGKIEGEIRCQNAVIEGAFEGTLNVKEVLNIRETAKVKGDTAYGKLIVQPGGEISGTMNLHGAKVQAPDNGSPKADAKVEKVAR
ncbi:MAG: polymer-forming cytoskeletal protein [Bacteroidetes bacterium]|nr:MAG: polymer-forming cytoskeletal protein [Bacteroidota bacterium]